VIRLILERIGLILYGLLSTFESVFNLILYITCLSGIIKPLDISVPFYFNFTDRFVKRYFLHDIRKSDGQDI
jgi:hypothetical protein